MNETNQLYHDTTTSTSKPAVRRWVPLVAGTTIAVIGVSRKSKAGAALAAAGGAVAYFGSWATQEKQDFVARGSVLLNCSPEEAYGIYRKFEDFPRFMRHLESVTPVAGDQYRWRVVGPLGVPLQWHSKIVEDRTGELISWRSLPDSDLIVEGSVTFHPAQGKRGTLLTAVTRYDHPAGKVGRAVAKLLGKDPSFLMQQDLRRFKAFVETGEIPTVEGQSHGPRSRLTGAMRLANPDRPVKPNLKINQVLNENRRTA